MSFVYHSLLIVGPLIAIILVMFFSKVLNVNKPKKNSYHDIDLNKLPEHIAIVMDGNGRWAIRQGKARIFGHEHAISNVKTIVKECAKLKIKYLTLYGFSTENWNRSKVEVDTLLNLITTTIQKELGELIINNVKIIFIGDIQRLPEDCIRAVSSAAEKSKSNTGMCLIIALSYSSKWEIERAIKKIIADSQKYEIREQDVDEKFLDRYLETYNIPDPDLLIRTSGEYRLSNFLLIQMAYTELYFTSVLWPNFTKEDLYTALVSYQNRDRRFGQIR
jgi:undecaprenyl diphosphate synthase